MASSPNTTVCKYIDFLYSDFSDSHWIFMFFTFKAPCYKYAVIIGIFCTGVQWSADNVSNCWKSGENATLARVSHSHHEHTDGCHHGRPWRRFGFFKFLTNVRLDFLKLTTVWSSWLVRGSTIYSFFQLNTASYKQKNKGQMVNGQSSVPASHKARPFWAQALKRKIGLWLALCSTNQ